MSHFLTDSILGANTMDVETLREIIRKFWGIGKDKWSLSYLLALVAGCGLTIGVAHESWEETISSGSMTDVEDSATTKIETK
jgi:hypothetical protein